MMMYNKKTRKKEKNPEFARNKQNNNYSSLK